MNEPMFDVMIHQKESISHAAELYKNLDKNQFPGIEESIWLLWHYYFKESDADYDGIHIPDKYLGRSIFTANTYEYEMICENDEEKKLDLNLLSGVFENTGKPNYTLSIFTAKDFDSLCGKIKSIVDETVKGIPHDTFIENAEDELKFLEDVTDSSIKDAATLAHYIGNDFNPSELKKKLEDRYDELYRAVSMVKFYHAIKTDGKNINWNREFILFVYVSD